MATDTAPAHRLADVLTREQEAQLAALLAQLMAHGWGTMEIEITGHQVRFFRPRPSIPAVQADTKNC